MATTHVILSPVTTAQRDATPPSGHSERMTVQVRVNANVVSGEVARRNVNRWLLWEIGELLRAGEPELLISEMLRWRVPVMWKTHIVDGLTSPISYLFVDAVSGEVMIRGAATEVVVERIKHAARAALQATA